ncbi:MAG: dihydroorotase [Pseudomonadota bacterium]
MMANTPHDAANLTADASPRPVTFLNARLLDPVEGTLKPGGLLVRDGKIADISERLRRNAPAGTRVIDCQGHILAPGLIDMQVFTGEPGFEHRETLATASRAAAAGGVTTIVCMPQTEPVIDQVALVHFIRRRAADTASVNVHTMAAITQGLAGERMTEIGLLKEAGAIAFSNGKSSIKDTALLRNVLSYAKDFDALIVHHTEDPYLSDGAVMNAGEVATRLGLPGVPTAAETIVLERDLRLVEVTGGRYHAATISCAPSIDVIRSARAHGLNVTCGVSINHLTLNENDIGPYRTFFRLRPPLRSEDDRRAMVRAVKTGDIDVIVSSHDPQDEDTKRQPFAEAADGAAGLETLLAAALRLHHNDELDLVTLFRAMTINPARLLGLPAGRLEVGAPADLVLVDLDKPWVVDKASLLSRSKNSPFDEGKLQGRVLCTLVGGRTVFGATVEEKR